MVRLVSAIVASLVEFKVAMIAIRRLCWDRTIMVGATRETDELVTDWNDVVLQEVPPLQNIGPLASGDVFFPLASGDVFFGGTRSETAFGGDIGMVQGPPFTVAELERIRVLIKAHLVENACGISSKAAAAIDGVPLDQYHRVADDHDHGRLLSKLGRVLPAKAVNEIKQMSFFDCAWDAFGPYYLSDEENVGHEQICFRVVRPNRREDVGSLHCDSWFWDHFHFPVPKNISRVKVWVPVCGAPD